ncbi:methylglutaconyl-CoA hydratase [Catalinimonas alkaloidigena]|uniref:Methylglutaconyl-CoA hydratase n=1 Tax=Catalinimonas alkaloidigena TaxID=1075417 RepID=A0A1G9VQJ7_9BACT|nr:enoyl-CoA hydratase/isomerase family protein [Catalinimonas alkaloidigena]SDM74514.1 methylglutaconyl-CoA hydratase [Catalinimonas alkaloidigena]
MKQSTEQGYIKTDWDEGITTIEFFHPQSNSLPGALLQSLAQTIREEGQRAQTHLIVLRSGGDRAFCAGASFDELLTIENREQGVRFFSGFANVINACRTCPKLIVGRAQGKAVGGGVGLLAATDYCFATQYAEIKLSELTIGIGPFVVGPAIERKIGVSAFSQLSLHATTFFEAAWAKEKGLFAEVYDEIEEMDDALEVYTRQLAASNPAALQGLKAVFWKGTDHWDTLLRDRAELSGELVLSDFTRAAIRRFKQK